MYLLIDNYDSFTFNLWHYLRELGPEVEVRRNDEITVDEALALNPEGIVISPGPCDALAINQSVRPLAARSSVRQTACMVKPMP